MNNTYVVDFKRKRSSSLHAENIKYCWHNLRQRPRPNSERVVISARPTNCVSETNSFGRWYFEGNHTVLIDMSEYAALDESFGRDETATEADRKSSSNQCCGESGAHLLAELFAYGSQSIIQCTRITQYHLKICQYYFAFLVRLEHGDMGLLQWWLWAILSTLFLSWLRLWPRNGTSSRCVWSAIFPFAAVLNDCCADLY